MFGRPEGCVPFQHVMGHVEQEPADVFQAFGGVQDLHFGLAPFFEPVGVAAVALAGNPQAKVHPQVQRQVVIAHEGGF